MSKQYQKLLQRLHQRLLLPPLFLPRQLGIVDGRRTKRRLKGVYAKIGQSPYAKTLEPVIADLWRTSRVGSTVHPRSEVENALSDLTPEVLADVMEKYNHQLQKGGISLPGEYLKALLLRTPQEAALQHGLQGEKDASKKDAPSYDIDEYVRSSLAKMNSFGSGS